MLRLPLIQIVQSVSRLKCPGNGIRPRLRFSFNALLRASSWRQDFSNRTCLVAIRAKPSSHSSSTYELNTSSFKRLSLCFLPCAVPAPTAYDPSKVGVASPGPISATILSPPSQLAPTDTRPTPSQGVLVISTISFGGGDISQMTNTQSRLYFEVSWLLQVIGLTSVV
jgi:hypothetical protein